MAGVLLHAVGLVVFQQGRQNGGALACCDLVHHLDDRHLAAPGSQILCGLAAHHAAADDSHGAVDLLLTGQHLPGIGHVHAVNAGDAGCGAVGTHSVDDSLKTGLLQLLCRAGLPHAQVHTGVADCMDQILRGAAHLLLAGRHAGDVQLTAQRGGLLKQGHVVTAQSCHTGSFQTVRAAAQNSHLLFLCGRLDAAAVLIAIFGIEHAGQELAVLDGIGAALVAADAAADIAGLTGSDLCAPIRVCQQRTANSHHIRHAALDDALGHLGIHDTAHGADRHVDSLFDVTGDLDEEAVGLHTHRRNGIRHVAGVVGLCNVEHIHAVLHQPLGKLHGVGFVNAALAALRGDDG